MHGVTPTAAAPVPLESTAVLSSPGVLPPPLPWGPITHPVETGNRLGSHFPSAHPQHSCRDLWPGWLPSLQSWLFPPSLAKALPTPPSPTPLQSSRMKWVVKTSRPGLCPVHGLDAMNTHKPCTSGRLCATASRLLPQLRGGLLPSALAPAGLRLPLGPLPPLFLLRVRPPHLPALGLPATLGYSQQLVPSVHIKLR